MQFGSVIPAPGSGKAPTAPVGLRLGRLCGTQSLPLTGFAAMVRCFLVAPYTGLQCITARLFASMSVIGFASQVIIGHRVQGREAE